MAIAEFNFKADRDGELCLIKGEKYFVYEIDEWAVVAPESTPNIRGLVPLNYL